MGCINSNKKVKKKNTNFKLPNLDKITEYKNIENWPIKSKITHVFRPKKIILEESEKKRFFYYSLLIFLTPILTIACPFINIFNSDFDCSLPNY